MKALRKHLNEKKKELQDAIAEDRSLLKEVGYKCLSGRCAYREVRRNKKLISEIDEALVMLKL